MNRRVCFGPLAILLLALGAEASSQAKPKVDVHVDPALLDKGLGLWQQASPEAKARAVQALRDRLHELRGPVAEHMASLVERREVAAAQRIDDVMDLLAWCGVLLLLVPVVYYRRFPGRFATLVWQSLLAAGWFFVTVHLFAVPLLMFFSFTMQLTEQLDPRVYGVDPVFDILDRNAAALLSHDLPIGPTLDQMQAGQVDSFLSLLLGNLIELREQARIFAPLLHLLRWLEALTGPLLHVETLLVVALFVWSVFPVFASIARLPLRAAAGEEGGVRRVFVETLRDWWREILSVLGVLPLFLVLVLALETILDTMSRIGTQAFLEYVVVTLEYLAHAPSPSYAVIFVTLGCLAFFFFLAAGVLVLASWAYLIQVQRLLRLRFHEGVPMREYRDVALKATLAVIWVLALPVMFVHVAVPGIRQVFLGLSHAATPHYALAQLSAGFLLAAGLLALLRYARGFRALRYLLMAPIPLARLREPPASKEA